MKELLLSLSGIFGVLPGAAVIIIGLYTPPGRKALFGGIIEALGCLTLLILLTNSGKLTKLGKKRATNIAVLFGIVFFLFLLVYISLASYSIKTIEGRGTAYYPLWTGPKLSDLVSRAGGRSAAIEKYGIDEVIEKTEKPEINLIITDIVLIFFYQGIFTSLTIAFGILGFRIKKES